MKEHVEPWSKWIERVKGPRGQRVIVILGLLGMLLILLSSFWPTETAAKTDAEADTLSDYAEKLETRLCELMSGVEGVGACRVMITLDNGTEYVYTTQTVLVTEMLPKVRGVVVVCDGGDDPIVQERVTEVITTALNISSRRVCVTKST